MKGHNNQFSGTDAFVVCVPVEAQEIRFLAETIREIISKRSLSASIVVFTSAKHGDAVQAAVADFPNEAMVVATSDAHPFFRIFLDLPSGLSGRDVLIVRPRMELPESWDARLRASAYVDPAIGCVSPLCDSSPVFALSSSSNLIEGPIDSINRAAFWLGGKGQYEMPFFLEDCAYFKNAALKQIQFGKFETVPREKLAWAISHELSGQGFLTVASSHVYVRPLEKNPGAAQVPCTDEVEVARILKANPLAHLRRITQETLRSQQPLKDIPGLNDGVVQLHVMHGWGGGLEHWVKTYCAADKKRKNLILKPIGNWGAFGECLALYDTADCTTPIAQWDFTRPIRATAISHLEYKRALDHIIKTFGVDYILVSSVIGHSLDLLCTDVKTSIIFHDYYPFCPAINIYFNQVCTECGHPRLNQCFQQNQFNRFFRNVSADDWMPLRQKFREIVTSRSIPCIVPTESVREHWIELEPAFAQVPFTVIGHGMNREHLTPLEPPAEENEKLKVVVLGNLTLHKGYELFKQAHREMLPYADFYLVGSGIEGEDFAMSGIRVIRQYQQQELPKLLERIAPDCGLLLSIWPETFSFTLSELSEFGIPPIATNMGAFKNRIQSDVNGILFAANAQELVETIKRVHRDRSILRAIRDNLRRTKGRSLDEMVAAYHAVFPDTKFSPRRYWGNAADDRFALAPPPAAPLGTPKSFGTELKKFVRQQIKTPTIRAIKRRVRQWMATR